MKDLTDTSIYTVSIKNNVTLDLNGHDLAADYVMVFDGLIKNSTGSAKGKLITNKNSLVYIGKTISANSTGNVLPVWDVTANNGYIFCNVDSITNLL